MGCVSSKADINDTHPNIFEVMNVDEMRRLISPGQLELTDAELILYQRGKAATRWPLRCLRKYGFDSEIFSFECGRRCPTGPGIYAFRCRRAEQLFNMLQQNIQLRNINEEPNPPVAMYRNFINPAGENNNPSNEFPVPVPVASTGPPVHRRVPSQTQPEGYLNPTPVAAVRQHPSLSRPDSLTSNGPTSPVSPPILSPPPDIILEHNNNKQSTLVSLPEHSYTNTGAAIAIDPDKTALPSYINISNTPTGAAGSVAENYTNLVGQNNCHLYMNVDTSLASTPGNNTTTNTKDMPNILPNTTDIQQDSLDAKPKHALDLEEAKHCYANIDAADLECLRATFNPSADLPLLSPSVPETPTYVTVREVNYAELDLVPSKSEHSSLQVTPDSPNKPNKSYVTIDFKKTNALSQSVNPSIDVEEGSRKTRHNSTISDITTRHSNSLSD